MCVSVGFWFWVSQTVPKAYRNTLTWLEVYPIYNYIFSTHRLSRIYCKLLKISWTAAIPGRFSIVWTFSLRDSKFWFTRKEIRVLNTIAAKVIHRYVVQRFAFSCNQSNYISILSVMKIVTCSMKLQIFNPIRPGGGAILPP